MQSLVIKLIYERQGSETPEIRRVSVPCDTAQSYTFINEKVMQVFPHLEADTFKLCWTDEDGDLVTFSSQEELEDALRSARDSVMKIIVREHEVIKRAEGVTSPEANIFRRSRAFVNETSFRGCSMMNMDGVQPRHFRTEMRRTGKGPQRGRRDDVERAPDGDVKAMTTLRNCNKSGLNVCRTGRPWQLHADEACTENGWRPKRRHRRSDPAADERDTATGDVVPIRVCWRRWRRQRELGGFCQRGGAENDGGHWRRPMMQGERHLQQHNAPGGTSPLNSRGQRWRRHMMCDDARVLRNETSRKFEGPWRRQMMQEGGLHRDATTWKCPRPWIRRAKQEEDHISLNPHWRSMHGGRASRFAMGKDATEPYYGRFGKKKSFRAGCGGFQASCNDDADHQRPVKCHMGHRRVNRKRRCQSNEADFRRWFRHNDITEDQPCTKGHCADGSFDSCQRRRVRCMGFPGNMPGCKRTNEGRCLKRGPVRFCNDEAESHDKNFSDTAKHGCKWQRACPGNVRHRCRLEMIIGETTNFKSPEDECCGVKSGRFSRKTLHNYYGHDQRHGLCGQMKSNIAGYSMLTDSMKRSHRRGPRFQIHRLRIVRRMRRLRYLLGLSRFHKNQHSGMYRQRKHVMKTCRRGIRLHLHGTGQAFGMGTHMADTVTCHASYPNKFSMGNNSTNCRKHERKIMCQAMGKSWGRHKACYRGFGRMMRSNRGKAEGRMTCQKKDVCYSPEDAGTQTPFKLTFHEMRRLFLMRRILQRERRQFRIGKLLASRVGHGRWSNRPVMMMSWRGRTGTCAHAGPWVLSVA